MPTAEKASVIEQTKAKYQKSAGVLFTEYRGLKVSDIQDLRKQLKAKGGEFSVVKNTLFKLAAGDDAASFPEDMTSGPTAIAFLYENESECAKVLSDFAKTHKALVLKGGFIAGANYDAKQVDALAKLPPKEVLIAQVIGTIVAPLTNLVGTIEAIYAQPIRTIYAAADELGAAPSESKKEEPPAETPVEEPVAEAPAEAAAEPAAEATPESEETAATTSEPTAEEAPTPEGEPAPEETTE
ncbi:MAG: 50S ribosomal protein L10 [Armatimonadetes bacterium]|nr:50S ribosomal protein L10 [Armatimonadota bacterium]